MPRGGNKELIGRAKNLKRPAAIVALILVTASVVSVSLWFFHQAPREVPADLLKLTGDLSRHVPWYCRFISARHYQAIRAGKKSWIPQRLLNHADLAVTTIPWDRAQARWKLAQLGTNAWCVIPDLLAALSDKDFEVGWSAANVLVRIRADEAPLFESCRQPLAGAKTAVRPLMWVVFYSDEFQRPYNPDARRRALIWLGACGPGAVSEMPLLAKLAAAQGEEHDIRSQAVRVLGSMGVSGNGATPTLKGLLRDPEEWPDVRGAACWALARVAARDPELPGLLAQALSDSKARLRIGAAESAHELRILREESLRALKETLNHKLVTVRCESLRVIGAMAGNARPLRDDVNRLIKDEHEAVRRSATTALVKIGG